MPDSTYPDIGLMRQRLVWQQATFTTSQSGQTVPSWSTVGTYWAHVEPMRGMELYNASQTKTGTWHKVRMRNVGSITPKDRFLFEDTGRILNVESVLREDERNAYLIIQCTEQITPSTL